MRHPFRKHVEDLIGDFDGDTDKALRAYARELVARGETVAFASFLALDRFRLIVRDPNWCLASPTLATLLEEVRDDLGEFVNGVAAAGDSPTPRPNGGDR